MRQINRKYQLEVGDTRTSSGIVVTDLQVSFNITKTSSNTENPNHGSIDIVNLSDDSLRRIDVDYPACRLKVAYGDEPLKTLWVGEVISVSTRKQGTERVTTLGLGDSYTSLNHKIVSALVAPGATVRDAVERVRRELTPNKGVYNGTRINLPLTYGYPLQGTPRAMLNEIAEKYLLEWQLDDGVLYVHDKEVANNNSFQAAYQITPETGLVESAYRTSGDNRLSSEDESKKQSAQWTMLLNPDVEAGSIVYLRDTLTDGYYKLTEVRHTGGYRDTNWYTECKAEAIERVKR